MPTIPPSDHRGTLVTEEPRLRIQYHRLWPEIAERRDLSAGAKVVYTVLGSYWSIFDDVFPGMDRLSRDTGEPLRSLARYMNELKAVGLLAVRRRGLGKTNIYILPAWPA